MRGYIEIVNKKTGELYSYLTVSVSDESMNRFILQQIPVDKQSNALMEHDDPYELINRLNTHCAVFYDSNYIYKWLEVV